MHSSFKHSLSITLVLAMGACGSDDESGSDTSAEETAGSTSTPSAGKVASSAGRTGNAQAGAGASGRASAAGTAGSVPRAGSAAPQQPSTAGKSGAGGMVADLDDAGVPETGGSGGSSAAGSSGGSSAAGSGGASAAGSGGSSASAATFTQVYALLNNGCAGAQCHINATRPAAMLSLADKATAYENLVNADATECPGEKRVVPNDPASSELLASLKHVQVGSCARTPRMPDNLPRWDDADIELVSSWIEAGALDN